MPHQRIASDFLNACSLAGIGVMAVEFEVRVNRLTLRSATGRKSAPTLTPFTYYAQDLDAAATTAACQDYVTVLMAGSVGRLLGLEYHLDSRPDSFDRKFIAHGFMLESTQGCYAESDVAFSLAFAWLKAMDRGDTEKALRRLWRRANQLLREPMRYANMLKVLEELRQKGELEGEDLRQLIK